MTNEAQAHNTHDTLFGKQPNISAEQPNMSAKQPHLSAEQPKLHTFEVTRDFEAAWELMCTTWYHQVEQPLAAALAGDELTYYLTRATFARSAWKDGQLLGFVFARHGQPEDDQQAAWDSARALVEARYGELLAAQQDDDGYLREINAYHHMLNQAQLAEDDSVLLLVINPAARGFGLGKKLFFSALDYLYEQGASMAHLITDTDCDWHFYDHLGLTRLAERKNGDPTSLQPDSYFLYGYNFENDGR